ncbi:hypothetical protein K7G19_21130 [Cupriavidus sp. DB3]|uniref:hypothetical protein n=1 Tax=Cupriavidus sp. DB3 TaxID=2873259 RepID=UPI001CF4ED39|nr:hypothetical protein [Cupriavidus sp. DB3]MCA7086098.1 hypothetical protein [Cupriavidus sp. DB3]
MTNEKVKRLTAAEAREIAGPTVSERVDLALDRIREAAEKKQREVALHGDFWAHGGYGSDRTTTLAKQYDEAVRQLKDLGFKVRFFYEERQFVDMYTIVEW